MLSLFLPPYPRWLMEFFGGDFIFSWVPLCLHCVALQPLPIDLIHIISTALLSKICNIICRNVLCFSVCHWMMFSVYKPQASLNQSTNEKMLLQQRPPPHLLLLSFPYGKQVVWFLVTQSNAIKDMWMTAINAQIYDLFMEKYTPTDYWGETWGEFRYRCVFISLLVGIDCSTLIMMLALRFPVNLRSPQVPNLLTCLW